MSDSSGRNRYRRPARRQPYRDPRPKLLIVCEGENTETQYFNKFAEFHRNSLVKVEVATEHDKALAAVRIAKKLKDKAIASAKQEGDKNLRYNSVWCVFDKDDHPYVAEAILMAKKNNIKIALSNPCFELWLILHLRESPGTKHRHKMQELLKKLVIDYDKNVEYEDYRPGYENAVVRAKKLDALAEEVGEPGRNPTTGVYNLTEAILPPKQKKKPKKPRRTHDSS